MTLSFPGEVYWIMLLRLDIRVINIEIRIRRLNLFKTSPYKATQHVHYSYPKTGHTGTTQLPSAAFCPTHRHCGMWHVT